MLLWGCIAACRADDAPTSAGSYASYTEIAEGVTSFGAAVIGDSLFVYGGHRGGEHDYSIEQQSDQFRRLKLAAGAKWEDLSAGPKLQGLAMVAHGGKLYRLGGFTARNHQDDDHDLHSVADVAVFDPATNVWTPAPSLPEPRSSHDAVVLGDKLFVVGGWQLRGKVDEPRWHDTAYVMDLSRSDPKWEPLPAPPFQRRALSLGSANGKVYAIGGMQPNQKVSCEVDVFDARTGKWSKGPQIPGTGMDGFGTSAFAVAGKLYLSNVTGKIFRLDEEEGTWNTSGKLKEARLFHRMLPLADGRLLIVGGAEWQRGKASSIYAVSVPHASSKD